MAYSNKYTPDGFRSMTDEELMAISDDEMEDEDPATCMALMRVRVERGLPARSTESNTA